VVTTIPVGPNPAGVAVTPNGAFVYVANSSSNTVSVVSTATNTVTATVTVGNTPVVIAMLVRTQGPTGKDQCKNDGWKTFTNPAFKNQGDCVSFVNHMNRQNN
jgi:YVTN family beta-propeller protein